MPTWENGVSLVTPSSDSVGEVQIIDGGVEVVDVENDLKTFMVGMVIPGTVETDAEDLYNTNVGVGFFYQGPAAQVVGVYGYQGTVDTGGSQGVFNVVIGSQSAILSSNQSMDETANTAADGSANIQTAEDDLVDGDRIKVTCTQGTNADASDWYIVLECRVV